MLEPAFSDDPIESVDADRLDRQGYVEYVARVLMRVRDRGSSSTVVGVIGPWGSGKTSVARLVSKELPSDWRYAKFEPWGYQDLTAMLVGFFAELREALPHDDQWSERRKKVGGVGRALSPIGALGGLIGVDGSGIIREISGRIEGDTSPSAVLEAASQAMADLSVPVLVTVDDLDRLSPEELLMVFKLVRFLGRLPNVYYLLCYDEQTLLDLLQRTDLAFESERRAQDYLEKMIQVRLDVPPLREQQAADLFFEDIESIFDAHNVVLDQRADERLQEAYRSTLRHRLTTPRAIGRFSNQLDAFVSSLMDEVDPCDFVLITWIRTFHPRLYELIHRSRAELTTQHFGTSYAEPLPDVKARWTEALASLGLDDQLKPIASLLSMLFLPIRAAWTNSTYTSEYYGELLINRSIGHRDFFDRYFAFSIPSDDIADSEVEHAIDNATDLEASVRLSNLLHTDPAKVARRISALMTRGTADPAKVLRFLAARGTTTASDVAEGGSAFHWVVREALLGVPADDGPDLIVELCDGLPGILVIADGVHREQSRQGRADLNPDQKWIWMDDAVAALNSSVERWLDAQPAPIPNSAASVAILWRWFSPERCQRWFRSHVQDHDLVATVESLLISKTDNQEERIVRPLTAETLESYFGRDLVLAAADGNAGVLSAPALQGDDWTGDKWFHDTHAARRELALASVKRAAAAWQS